MNLLPGLIIAVVAAYFTVKLSIKRFRSERWWERKAEAYSVIVEALHHMKNYCEEEIEAQVTHRDLPEEKSKYLSKKLNRGREEIAKATDIGAFIICEEAVFQLKSLKKNLESAQGPSIGSYYEYLEAQWSAIDNCLNAISKIAKKDLNVK